MSRIVSIIYYLKLKISIYRAIIYFTFKGASFRTSKSLQNTESLNVYYIYYYIHIINLQ